MAQVGVIERAEAIAAAILPPAEQPNQFFQERARGWLAALIRLAAPDADRSEAAATNK